MQTLKRYLRYLGIVYVSGVLLIAGVCVAMLKMHHMRLLSVQTGSMAQVFRPRDAVLISPYLRPTAQVGEVVSFTNQSSGTIISHRVVAVDPAAHQLTTKGDDVAKADTAINSDAVIGKVVTVLPYAGAIIDFIRRPIGLTLFVYMPALAIVLTEVKRLTSHYSPRTYRLFGLR